MSKTDISNDAEVTEDTAASSEVPQEASEEAKQLLAKSRYDAFRLVVEAREEADTILDEARAEAAGTLKAAQITAESKVDVAELHAGEIIDKAKERAAAIIEATDERTATDAPSDTTELRTEHQELTDQVDSLRALAGQLERRFAALAADTTPEGADTELAEPSPGTGKPILDYSPSVPRNDASNETDPTPVEESIDRGSFYSRRSANLPHIGGSSGQSAFSMTRSIRSKLETD